MLTLTAFRQRHRSALPHQHQPLPLQGPPDSPCRTAPTPGLSYHQGMRGKTVRHKGYGKPQITLGELDSSCEVNCALQYTRQEEQSKEQYHTGDAVGVAA